MNSLSNELPLDNNSIIPEAELQTMKIIQPRKCILNEIWIQNEIWFHVFSFLKLRDVNSFAAVCREYKILGDTEISRRGQKLLKKSQFMDL